MIAYTPRFTNLTALYAQSISKFGSRNLFGTRKPSGWQWTTYAQFDALVAQARAGLAGLGLKRSERVAVISNNRLEWAVCGYACFTSGAVYVPMYEAQLDKDWEYILRDSGAKVCLCANSSIAGRVRELMHGLPELKHVIDFQSDEYARMLAVGSAAPVPAIHAADRDCAMYIYTSGTTGNPKGVELSHYNLAANASAIMEVTPAKDHDESSLSFLPWAHVFGGCVELNSGIALGSTIAICDNTDKLIEYLPEVQPTMLFAVPRIWNRIYDGVQKQMSGRPKIIQEIFRYGMSAKSKLKRNQALGLRERLALPLAEKLIFAKVLGRFGGKLRFAFSGAAALSRDVAEFIDNLGIVVLEGYGLTESTGCSTASTPSDRRLGAVGKPVPGVDFKVDTNVSGASGDGEGELIIYGTGVMLGYHNLPEETAKTFTTDGGLRTGDLGRIDKDGFISITGRVKELYKLSNGKYVAPAPLEEKVQLSPYISQCFLYGTDKPHNVALLVPDMQLLATWAEGQGIDKATMLTDKRTTEHLQREIATQSREFKGYEAIRAFVLEAEPFSTQNDMLTPTLKIKRRNVMKRFGARLEALYK